MGFSIWAQELQPKQIINAIFDSVNYTEKFEQDIVESEKMVVISSPDIRQDKIDRFLLLVKKRQEVGVKVTVITTDPEDITYGKSDVCHELIRAMQLVGINVITRTSITITIINRIIPEQTSSNDVFPTRAATKRFTPSGGVMKPTASVTTIMIPK